MDLQMPVTDGVSATRQIHGMAPDTQVVILTSFSDRDRIVRSRSTRVQSAISSRTLNQRRFCRDQGRSARRVAAAPARGA